MFEHACFISYKHPPKNAPDAHFYREFARVLKGRLEFYLPTPIRTFIDEDADIGSSYPMELSRKLCRSVCMVAVLTPEYPDSSWCDAEWKAMELWESKRLGPNQKGLIIPVVSRGDVRQWEEHFKRKPVDLRVDLPSSQLFSVGNSRKIRQIAEIVSTFVTNVTDPCEDCAVFQLNVGTEQVRTPPSFKVPSPLSSI
jgi:hypothetical protein